MTATSMRPNLKPNPAWASLPLFDRAGWKRMAFGEFVESIGERAEPRDAQEEIYVGLEHLDPQCLHIRRWGKGSDVIGGKLRFRKGDIIFGKRRAYQRKLAVAEFGGICSAHAMVVRARPDKVLPEFLPFLMMSDRFMNRAVEISVGSLSPTINWTTLKLETFDLPPLDQQRRIAEILWAVDETIQGFGIAKEDMQQLVDSTVSVATATTDRVELDSVCEVITKGTTPTTAGYDYIVHGVGFLRAENLQDVELDNAADLLFVSREYHELQRRSQIFPGDVLLSIAGTVGRSALVPLEYPGPLNCNQAVAIIRPRDLTQGEAIFRWLQTHDAKRQFSQGVVKGTIQNLSLGIIGKLKIPDPKCDSMTSLVSVLKELERIQSLMQVQISCLARLQTTMLEACSNV